MTERKIKLLGVSGSLRKASSNTGLLRVAAKHAPDGLAVEIFDLSAIPLYDGDVEATSGFPASVVAFREAIAAADGLLIACPEYNFSVPGVLKNALDWASRAPAPPFAGKPLAIMGTGGWHGAARAHYHLRQIAVNLDMLVLNKPEVQIPDSAKLFGGDGELTRPEVAEKIVGLLTAFEAWIRRLS